MHDFFCFYREKDREREFLESREGGGDLVPSVTKISVKCYLGPIF